MTAFDEFSALARSWPQFYRTRETTYIAVGLGDSWYLLYSRELFHVDEPLDTRQLISGRVLFERGRFRTKLDESNASEIMEGALAECGKVTVGEWSVGLSDKAPLNDRFDRLYPARAGRPTYVMESGAVDLRNSKDALALELLACNIPYENLEELCVELGIPIAPGELTQMTHTEIILGNLFRLDDACALKDGRLNLKIVAPCSVEQC